jgi:hypothetical protein
MPQGDATGLQNSVFPEAPGRKSNMVAELPVIRMNPEALRRALKGCSRANFDQHNHPVGVSAGGRIPA